MNYWLMKSEPSTWSWDDQLARGEDGEGWDGVRNHQASNNMKAMEIGDLAFFYHSVNEKQIVGIVEVCETYHPDPTDASGRFGMVTVKAVKPMVRPHHRFDCFHGDHAKASAGVCRVRMIGLADLDNADNLLLIDRMIEKGEIADLHRLHVV